MGIANASVHGGPTALTITPQFADVMATAANAETVAEGGIELAQNQNVRKRIRRQERRRANRRLRQTRREVTRNTRRRVARQTRQRIYRNNRWYYYNDNGRWYDDSGAALAAGLVGLAAGAAIAGSYNNRPDVVVVQPEYGIAPYTAEWYRRCDIKYNSFRASDGTYLGYDGYRHTCRLP